MNNYPDVPQANILVIDDTPANLQLLRKTLLEQNYKVRPVADSGLALQAAQTEPPDLILLDIMMPGIDGLEVCRRLKANPATAEIPIIFMTVLDQPEDKVRGFEAGGVDYLTKPLHIPEVLARVNTHLTLSCLQRQLEIDKELLEQRVRARTAQLTAANQDLQAEIERRIRHQQEKERLFDLTRQQSEQLRRLTTLLLESQQQRQQALAHTFERYITPYLTLLGDNLRLMQKIVGQNTPAEAIDLLPDYLLDFCSDIRFNINKKIWDNKGQANRYSNA
ncbi:MAG: response regulator, partial [Anaerolineae bacterium]|nr:response regulator [Anaerolineae bacterium]